MFDANNVDHVAALAMHAIISRGGCIIETVAPTAYQFADAFIAQQDERFNAQQKARERALLEEGFVQ